MPPSTTITIVLPILLAHLLDNASAAPVPKAHAAQHTLAPQASLHTADVGRPDLSTLALDVVVPLTGRRALDDAPAAATASVAEQFADQGASTGTDWTKLGIHLGEGWAQGTETASNTLEQVDNLSKETHDAFTTLAGAPPLPVSRRNLDGMHSLPTEFADTLVDYGALGAGVGMGWITGNESPKTTVEQFAHQAGITSDDFVSLSTGVELHLVNHTDDPTPPVRTPPQQAVDLLASASHAVVGAADSLLTGRRLEGDDTEGPQTTHLTLPSPGAVAWQALSTAADYSLLGMYNGARWAVGLETPQHSAADYGTHGQQNLNNWKDLFVEHRASGDGETASTPDSEPAAAPDARM